MLPLTYRKRMKEDSCTSTHKTSLVLSSSNQNGSTVTAGLLCKVAAFLQPRNYSSHSDSQKLQLHL